MKRKQLYLTGLLLFSAVAARAEPSRWEFSYTGFLHEFSGTDATPISEFDPTHVIRGVFIGEDLNHDNVLDLSEISKLVINNYDYIACPPGPDDIRCRIDRFSFALDGGLDFSIYRGGREPPLAYYWENTFETGNAEHFFSIFARAGVSWDTYYRWTPETAFTIQSVVPEPGQYAMLAAGLLAATGLRTRRQRKSLGSGS
ncbi:PEP-CTERM sorting domain-containing protein [Massilia horti]|nr:PEP-CTERM sorting domain-containing protein [Massilia horti]